MIVTFAKIAFDTQSAFTALILLFFRSGFSTGVFLRNGLDFEHRMHECTLSTRFFAVSKDSYCSSTTVEEVIVNAVEQEPIQEPQMTEEIL